MNHELETVPRSLSHLDTKKAILRSQHCQRNWDLKAEIPKEDLDLFVTAVTQCPSKQNVAFYKAHFITNRSIIEKIHDQTDGFTVSYDPPKSTTNTQVLANLLVVFEETSLDLSTPYEQWRNTQTKDIAENNLSNLELSKELIKRDRQMAVGIAAGYLNLTASLFGYSTGCCACFYPKGVKSILNLENDVLLLMGIGFGDPNLNRRVHHLDHQFTFPVKKKHDIEVNFIK